MTTMKLNHAYLTFSIAAVCSGYLDSLNDASPQLQRSWQGLGRVLTPLSTRAGPFRAVMTAVKTTNTSPHACALGCGSWTSGGTLQRQCRASKVLVGLGARVLASQRSGRALEGV